MPDERLEELPPELEEEDEELLRLFAAGFLSASFLTGERVRLRAGDLRRFGLALLRRCLSLGGLGSLPRRGGEGLRRGSSRRLLRGGLIGRLLGETGLLPYPPVGSPRTGDAWRRGGGGLSLSLPTCSRGGGRSSLGLRTGLMGLACRGAAGRGSLRVTWGMNWTVMKLPSSWPPSMCATAACAPSRLSYST